MYWVEQMEAVIEKIEWAERGNAPRNRYIKRAMTEIREELPDYAGLAVVARDAGTTRGHLQRLFKQFAGMTPGAYVRGTRIARAGSFLVLETESTVNDVAVAVGYTGASVLDGAFRVNLGVTPSFVRKQGRLETMAVLRRHRRWLSTWWGGNLSAIDWEDGWIGEGAAMAGQLELPLEYAG